MVNPRSNVLTPVSSSVPEPFFTTAIRATLAEPESSAMRPANELSTASSPEVSAVLRVSVVLYDELEELPLYALAIVPSPRISASSWSARYSPSVPPSSIVTALAGTRALSSSIRSVPASTVTPPVNEVTASSSSSPVPFFTREPVPLISPSNPPSLSLSYVSMLAPRAIWGTEKSLSSLSSPPIVKSWPFRFNDDSGPTYTSLAAGMAPAAPTISEPPSMRVSPV